MVVYRWTLLGMVVMICGVLFAEESAGEKLQAALKDDCVAVSVDGQLFTQYKFSKKQKYPYFYPVVGPRSQQSLTTESSEPYPHHHSLFFGCDKVNGGNYWQESNRRGQILSQGVSVEEASGDRVVFRDICLWKQPRQEPVIKDRRIVTITAPSKTVRYIDFEIVLEALTDVVIEKTNHSLFSARMTSALSVASGGTLVNAEGATAEAGTFGVASPWCDYSGTWQDGVIEGLAIFQHPGNPGFPAKWFTRDYGFFSPTPMYWPADDKATYLKKGETVQLRYRVVVHEKNAVEARIPACYREYEK